MRIVLADYLMGREQAFPGECTPVVLDNAAVTVERANSLLAVLEAENVEVEKSPQTGTIVTSGWRPPQLNAAVANAAPRSKHMSGQAIDIYDPDGLIDTYLMTEAGQRALVSVQLWLEHPSATKSWTHWQSVPPRSNSRVFYP